MQFSSVKTPISAGLLQLALTTIVITIVLVTIVFAIVFATIVC
jgi:hypothetical protein